MRPDLWIAFVVASLVIGLVPGPGVAAIVGYAIGSGRRTAFASVAGMAIGNLLAAAASLAGVGALLVASVTAFAVLKWAGAAYLIGLGLWTIRGAGRTESNGVRERPAISPRVAFAGTIGIGTFHPKTLVFLAAFAPQFIDPARDYAVQASVLAITFAVTLGTTDCAYAWLASGARSVFASPKARRWSERAGGGAMVFAGAATAAMRR